MGDQRNYSTMVRLAKELRDKICAVCDNRLGDKFAELINACREADETIRTQYDGIQTLIKQRDSLFENYNAAVEQLGYDLFDNDKDEDEG